MSDATNTSDNSTPTRETFTIRANADLPIEELRRQVEEKFQREVHFQVKLGPMDTSTDSDVLASLPIVPIDDPYLDFEIKNCPLPLVGSYLVVGYCK